MAATMMAPLSARSAACTSAPHSARSAATLAGKGTGYGALENAWSRERTAEGQVYYYNHATGSSQWHLPNELYESNRGKTKRGRSINRNSDQSNNVVFPGEARATLGVDCITEAIPAQEVGRSLGETSFATHANISDVDPRDIEKVLSHLPLGLASFLRGEDFQALCWQSFSDVADRDSALSTDDAAMLVGALACEVRIDPPLRLSSERCRVLTSRFAEAAGLHDLGDEDFLALACYTVAVQYLERAQGLEN